MGRKTKIEWTDGGATWTPIRARNRATGKVGWHCEHATPGCENCYAESINKRLGTGLPFKPGHRDDIELFLDEKMLLAPLRWTKPRMIFAGSMTDLFANFVPDAWLDRIFAVMALAPRHTFQVLTKRSERMRAYFDARRVGDPWAEAADDVADMIGMKEHPIVLEPRDLPLPNVWLGVSAEDQRRADERVPDLLATPAAVRFVSAEPLLGPIDFMDVPWTADRPRFPATDDLSDGRSALHTVEGTKLDLIIVGGESGPGARPMHLDWARSIRDQCAAADVAFFFKQFGEFIPAEFQPSTLPFVDNPTDKSSDIVIDTEGTDCTCWQGPDQRPPFVLMRRVGKRRAGRLLDGVEHNAFPEARR